LGLPPLLQVGTMCVLQTGLIVGAIFGLARLRGITGWRLTTAVLVSALFPPVFLYFGILWRDVVMAGFLLMAVYFLESYSQGRSRKSLIAALGALVMACVIRQNAIFAAFPLVLWTATLVSRTFLKRCFVVLILGFAGSLVLGTLGYCVNLLLASTNAGVASSSTMFYDLMGISDRTGELLLPVSLTSPGYSLDTVRSHYQDEYNDLTGLRLPASRAALAVVYTAWRRAVLQHPRPYFEHRAAVTLRFLGITGQPHLPFARGIPVRLYPSYIANRAYYVPFPARPFATIPAGTEKALDYWWFRHWLYASLGIAVVLFQRNARGAAFWACVSGLVYLASSFVLIPSTDFRYGWWTVLASVAGCVLCLFERSEPVPKS
jgi:hypothetical protein